MHAERENAVVVVGHGGCAIALVHVEVNDEHAVGHAVGQQQVGGKGQIIQQTEAFRPIRKGVVRTTGDVESHVASACGLGAGPGTLHDDGLPPDQFRGPRESRTTLFSTGPRSAEEACVVGWRMTAHDILSGHGRGGMPL